MTVAEFFDRDAGDRRGALRQLRDGDPEIITPATDAAGTLRRDSIFAAPLRDAYRTSGLV